MKVTLGELLSVMRGCLLCPMDRVYEVLSFLTGTELFTHQLPRAGRCASPTLQAQFPAVAAIDCSEVTPDNWQEILAKAVAEHGDEFELTPLPRGTYQPQDPIGELIAMRPDAAVVIAPAQQDDDEAEDFKGNAY